MNIYHLSYNYLLKRFFILLIIMGQLNAVIYEDAEDLSTKGWTIVKTPYVEKIDNIFD